MRTVTPLFKLDEFRSPTAHLWVSFTFLSIFSGIPTPIQTVHLRSLPPRRNFPQLLHMFTGYHLIPHATQHQDRCTPRYEREFGHGVPFLVTQEGQGTEEWEGVWHYFSEGSEGVFEDECIDLVELTI